MKKITTPNQWLRLAVGDDNTRPQLTDVWCDSTSRIGADGHRMHILHNQPDIGTRHLEGADLGEFPDHQRVTPNKKPGAQVLGLGVKQMWSAFDVLISAAKLKDPTCRTVEISAPTEGILRLTAHSGPAIGLVVALDLQCEGGAGLCGYKIGVNASYLAEALQLSQLTGEPPIIQFNGPTGGIRIDHGDTATAVCMPVRL